MPEEKDIQDTKNDSMEYNKKLSQKEIKTFQEKLGLNQN
jgi:hypothetical protein